MIKIDGVYHYYDSCEQNGIAVSTGVSLYSKYKNVEFKNNAHYYIFIEDERQAKDTPQINADFASLWDQTVTEKESLQEQFTDFHSLFESTPTKKEQLLDEHTIKVDLKEKHCCEKNCLQKVLPEEVLRKRTKRASLNSEQSLVWLTEYIEEHLHSNTVCWQLGQQSICSKAFAFIHGYSLKKMYKARNIVLNGSIVPLGINRLGIEKGKKKLSVKVWITVYCQFFGDYRPDKKEIHLPCYMT